MVLGSSATGMWT